MSLGILAGLGHYCLIKAFTLASPSKLAPYYYCQIIWVATLGYTMFGDVIGVISGLGIALIVAGGLFGLSGDFTKTERAGGEHRAS